MAEIDTTVRYGGKEGTSFRVDVSLQCPWCGIACNPKPRVHHDRREGGERELWIVAVCTVHTCQRASLLLVKEAAGIENGRLTYPAQVFPMQRATYAPDGVPEQIATEFREAIDCHKCGYHIAAALVGRRVLQAAARDVLGREGENLKAEIAAIPESRLSGALKEQATHVRLIGNDAAHVEAVDRADVSELIDFVEAVLDALYVGPERVRKLQAKREAKKQAAKKQP